MEVFKTKLKKSVEEKLAKKEKEKMIDEKMNQMF